MDISNHSTQMECKVGTITTICTSDTLKSYLTYFLLHIYILTASTALCGRGIFHGKYRGEKSLVPPNTSRSLRAGEGGLGRDR